MKRIYFCYLIALLSTPLCLPAQQGLSDAQVATHIKEAIQAGKSQNQIGAELIQKGVSKEQAQRVKALLNKEEGNGTATTIDIDRSRSKTAENNKVTPQDSNNEGTPIYGREIFNTSNLTFEPSENFATPPNYRLGAGDDVIIDVWGTNQDAIRTTISPDGYISISELGLIYLNGMTVREAESYLRGELSKIYDGLSKDNPTSEIKLTLGNSRTIQINVMGEVRQPGTYALSAFSSVFHALYRAGGMSSIGSLRSIQVVRQGRKIASVDVYDFIMRGKTQDDIRLQEGDVIIVPPYDAVVKIEGKIKRPMRYEMKKGESVAALLQYAGGFSGDAHTKNIRLVRQDGEEYALYTVDDKNYTHFKLQDGDVITIDAILQRFKNKVEIKGSVYRPGAYQLSEQLNTVSLLVKKAAGLMEDAFPGRALLQRTHENLQKEVIPLDIIGIMNGNVADIPLQKNDVLYIPSIQDLEDQGPISIQGEIVRPGTYDYAKNTSIEDLIIKAGGLKEAASMIRVDVSRRIKNRNATQPMKETSLLFSFALKDGFIIDGNPNFVLEPYDMVFVRRSPGYQEQQNVFISGEVLYKGAYTLSVKNERLSSIIAKAGGTTPDAYLKGARLHRRINEVERKHMEDLLKLANKGETDSLAYSPNDIGDVYYVGINLEEALKNPGGEEDIVLREGDRIEVPQFNNTVRISGTVMQNNVVTYKKGADLRYYIDQAGGYGYRAKKSKVYIVYMNGQIQRVKGNGKKQIEPGCEIIVPQKIKRANSLQTTLAGATTGAALATVLASLVNIFK